MRSISSGWMARTCGTGRYSSESRSSEVGSAAPKSVLYVEHVATGTDLFRVIRDRDMEGIVAKQASARYTPRIFASMRSFWVHAGGKDLRLQPSGRARGLFRPPEGMRVSASHWPNTAIFGTLDVVVLRGQHCGEDRCIRPDSIRTRRSSRSTCLRRLTCGGVVAERSLCIQYCMDMHVRMGRKQKPRQSTRPGHQLRFGCQPHFTIRIPSTGARAWCGANAIIG
jgi:hypothetical protein